MDRSVFQWRSQEARAEETGTWTSRRGEREEEAREKKGRGAGRGGGEDAVGAAASARKGDLRVTAVTADRSYFLAEKLTPRGVSETCCHLRFWCL